MDRPNLESLSSETGYLIEVRDYALDVEARLGRAAEALDSLLGCIVAEPDGELALVPGSETEVESARAVLASGEGEPPQ